MHRSFLLVRLKRIVRRTMDRWCCLGVLFGIIFGLTLSMIVQMHRYVPASFSRGFYPTTDPTLDECGTQHVTESAAWTPPNKLLVVISLSRCDSQEVEAILSSMGRDIPSNSILFYSCCENLRLSSDQCFMHKKLECSSGRTPSLLSVLNHLWQREASRHRWFLIGSSLTYINYEPLVQFLDQLDSEELLYLGRPLRTGNSMSSWTYCEGEPGMVISRSLLRSLGPGTCPEQEDIKEDAHLGRCINEKYHIDCWGGINKVWSPFSTLAPDEWGSLKSADHLTHYPVQGRETKIALYVFYKQVEYWRLQEQLNHSMCVIREVAQRYNFSGPEQVLKFPSNSAEYTLSSDICFQKSDSTDPGVTNIQSWVYYGDQSFHYGTNSRTDYPPWHAESISVIKKDLRLELGRTLHWPLRVHLTYYARYDVNRGIEYSIDLKQKNLTKNKNPVNLLRPFMNFAVRETEPLSNRRVHFVVPVSSKRNTIHSFMTMYERIFLSTKQLTSLILSVYGEEMYTAVNTIINNYQVKYPNANFIVLKGMGTFSRSRALNLGMQELKEDDLAFHCDVDMEITNPGFLDRCRMNAVKNKSVYFPEVFKHFSMDFVFRYKKRPKGRLPIRRDTGHWGAYGYGMVCIYKADFLIVGGMDNKTEGWGLEDVDFFQRVQKTHIIFRAPDPALRHHWHPKNCSAITTADKYKECHASKILALGGRKELGRYILELEKKINY